MPRDFESVRSSIIDDKARQIQEGTCKLDTLQNSFESLDFDD